MKFKVDVKEKGKKVAVNLSSGSYKVNFERNEVEYFTGGKVCMYKPDISIDIEFCDCDMTAKEGFDGVKHYYDRIDIVEYDYIVDIEYLDLTNGKVPLHNHPGKTVEVYLSTEEPYSGEICLEGASHEPFAEKIIAVKIIPKE